MFAGAYGAMEEEATHCYGVLVSVMKDLRVKVYQGSSGAEEL